MWKLTGLVVITVVAIVGSILEGLTGQWTLSRVLMSIGGVFQIDGVLLVFAEIGQTERRLRLQPWLQRTATDLRGIAWAILGRLGIRRKQPVLVEVGAAGLGIMTGTATVTVTQDEGTTVEERLNSHQRQLAALGKELGGVGQRLDQERAERRAADAVVESRLRAEDESVRQFVRDLSGGFLRGRAAGGSLIVVGTLLITIGVWL